MAKTKGKTTFGFTEEQIKVIRTLSTCRNEAKVNEFLARAQLTGLNPIARQIILAGNGAIITTIDGMRVIAQRTGEYCGQVGPLWCGDDGVWKDVWIQPPLPPRDPGPKPGPKEDEEPRKLIPPTAAKVGVYRKGFVDPLWATVTWDSFGGKSGNWLFMPDHMLGKCAESHSLRRSMPEALSNVYSEEEMESVGHLLEEEKETPKPYVPPSTANTQMERAKDERKKVKAADPQPDPDIIGDSRYQEEEPKVAAASKPEAEENFELHNITYKEAAALLKACREGHHKRVGRKEPFTPNEFAKLIGANKDSYDGAEHGNGTLSRKSIWELHQIGLGIYYGWVLGTDKTKELIKKRYGQPKGVLENTKGSPSQAGTRPNHA